MLFCPLVKYNCCSFLDEMKFQHLWNTYYRTKLEKTFDKYILNIDVLQQYVQKFVDFTFTTYNEYIEIEDDAHIEQYNKIKKFDFEVFEKIKSEMKALVDIEM